MTSTGAAGRISGARVLVTGASGLLGAALSRELATDNEVFAAARWSSAGAREYVGASGAVMLTSDLADPDLSELPVAVDYVFHCGAGLPGSMSRAELFEVNVQATGRLMSRYRSAQAFVHCSSAAVYARKEAGSYNESDPVGVDRHPDPGYPMSKIAGEQLVTFLSRDLQLPAIILRVFALYGRRGGFPTTLIERVAAGEPVPLPPQRPVTQNPIHEKDFVAKAIAAAHVVAAPAPIINFAGSQQTSVEEYTAIAGELLGRPVQYVDVSEGYAPSPADVSLMEAMLGPTSTVIEDGVADVVTAWRDRQPARG